MGNTSGGQEKNKDTGVIISVWGPFVLLDVIKSLS